MNGYSGEVSKWDVCRAADMCGMLFYVTSFNTDASKWEMSSVTDKIKIFKGVSSFAQKMCGSWFTNMSMQLIRVSLQYIRKTSSIKTLTKYIIFFENLISQLYLNTDLSCESFTNYCITLMVFMYLQ